MPHRYLRVGLLQSDPPNAFSTVDFRPKHSLSAEGWLPGLVLGKRLFLPIRLSFPQSLVIEKLELNEGRSSR
jgi:hypothetical protein